MERLRAALQLQARLPARSMVNVRGRRGFDDCQTGVLSLSSEGRLVTRSFLPQQRGAQPVLPPRPLPEGREIPSPAFQTAEGAVEKAWLGRCTTNSPTAVQWRRLLHGS